jgi:hypothetical protein
VVVDEGREGLFVQQTEDELTSQLSQIELRNKYDTRIGRFSDT